MISVRALRKVYREGNGTRVEVLRELEWTVGPGEFAVVTGPSGSGKSTLLHILGALDTDYAGEVTVAGERVDQMKERARARFRNAKVGFVFQSFNLVTQASALENVLLPAYFGANTVGPSERSRAGEALAQVGLSGKEQRTPAQLSGGERQRVALARALFPKPQLLLCDEPTGNLDAATGATIVELLQSLNRQGMTVVGVTHEPQMSQAATRLFKLSEGRLVEAPSREMQ